MTKNNKCFGDGDGARQGIYQLNDYSGFILNNLWWQLAGQDEFMEPGTYTWVCPPGVTKVSAVCVGGGGGGSSSWANASGGGAGLGWKNDIPVTPGQSYTVLVGSGGSRGSTGSNGQGSYFISASTVKGGYGAGHGNNGESCTSGYNGAGGGYTGDGGGRGGDQGGWPGGGGAGGYTGDGGYGSSGDAPTTSGGGAGGFGYSSTHGSGSGGGTGIYGRRTDYYARGGSCYGPSGPYGKNGTVHWSNNNPGMGGQGGSERTGIISGEKSGYHGCPGENPFGFTYNGNDIKGGFPGGGGGGPGTSHGGGEGGAGAVRIMWAGEKNYPNRSYPSTDCEDVQ